MRRFSYALAVGFYVVCVGLPFHYATAQPQRARPPQSGPPSASIQPASDWLVWRAFYDSLEFYGRQSPSHVQELLVERLGFSVNEADLTLAAGRDYLQQLARLDDSARAEIKSRFQVESLDLPPPQGAPPDLVVNARARGGQSTNEALVASGFVTGVTNQRIALLAAHREALARTLGPARLASLDRFVRAEVAPSVRVVGLPPAALGKGSGSNGREQTPR